MVATYNHKLSSGIIVDGMVDIKIDLSKVSDELSCLLFSWSEIWLTEHCRKNWFIETKEITCKNRSLSIYFQDPKEAVLFKLSSFCSTLQFF
jgi:hypothetical protein